ncbi:MAG: ATP synthase F1 subunit epsilon [Alphaproteobacteria bacterium RIFCSPHIGHO2_12_FULL_66_14]|jgi:F-type H+-transporting ATPase subunit epsilon|nr:MAG: ATP synthase F1 subunit epsilon [Alphaproteobacteria bacterium RIFCSPHIGHO2_12_FULL_66_14]
MAKVNFRLVMPERELLATEADMVVVPGSEGDFGVLHGHAPLISTVRPGVLEVFQGSKAEQRFLVVGGFAEVTPERCTVLADEALPFETVTVEQLAERERAAERELTDAANDAEKAAATKNLAVAKDLRRAQAYYANR